MANIFIIICISVLIMWTASLILYNGYLNRKQINELTHYQINISSNIDNSIPQMLDDFIAECFKTLQLMNSKMISEEYINSEREAEIRSSLAILVGNRLSTAMKEKLALYYNENRLDEVIADKIFIIVMGFVVEHNVPFYKEEDE